LRTYEALYIVTPELDDDGIQTVAKEVEALVLKHGGSIVRSEIWGKRKLAYVVKKFSEGGYILLRFDAAADFLAKLDAYFKLSEQIIRYLVVHFDDHTLKLEAEQQRRREEDARPRARRDDDDDDDDEDAIPVNARRSRRSRDDDDDDDEFDE
jgi:small subunit ribosomal protein S6